VRAFSVEDANELPQVKFAGSLDLISPTLTPDGSRVLLATSDGKGFMFDLNNGEPLLSHDDPRLPVVKIALSENGQSALIVSHSNNELVASVYDTLSGKKLSDIEHISKGIPDPLNRYTVLYGTEFYISNDALFVFFLVKSTRSPSIRVWQNGTEVSELKRTDCVNPWIVQYELGVSHNQRAVFHCKKTEFIDPQARTTVDFIDTNLPSIGGSPSFDRILVDASSGALLYDGATGKQVSSRLIGRPSWGFVFSPDGAFMYGRSVTQGTKDADILWETRSGNAVAILSSIETTFGTNPAKFPVEKAIFSDQGSWLATKHGSALVLHDGRTGREVSRVIPDIQDKPRLDDMRFAGENRLITKHEGVFRLWDISWKPKQGRQLVDSVCREKLRGAQGRFTATEMQDPILIGREDMQVPCLRVGPLSFGWWVNELHRWIAVAL
jgi:hypothetical protein